MLLFINKEMNKKLYLIQSRIRFVKLVKGNIITYLIHFIIQSISKINLLLHYKQIKSIEK